MENNEMKFCQSCAMPLGAPDLYGTNADGSRSEDYCHYCFQNGAFTKEETMDEMIETCVPFVSKGEPWPDEATARKAMQELFPQLKRWKR
ncbi:MAG: transcriptional regulator [Clostridiales bacterium GWC2_40_7]|nr:MAG: transcriptional regulator [Clostridiales bacterium GWC2_40_7]